MDETVSKDVYEFDKQLQFFLLMFLVLEPFTSKCKDKLFKYMVRKSLIPKYCKVMTLSFISSS